MLRKLIAYPAIALTLTALAGCAATGMPTARSTSATSAVPSSTIASAPLAATGNLAQLRVMSFNLRVKTFLDVFNPWSRRRDVLAAVVQRFNPDVLSTQECLASQLTDLQQRLPNYSTVFAGRDDGLNRGEMCAIFYRTDRLTKEAEGHFWLSNSPQDPGSRSWGEFWPRLTTWAKLRPHGGGQAFYVFDSHFPVFVAGARIRAAELLRSEIGKIAGNSPVLIMGDFNTTEDSSAYRVLVDAGLASPWIDTYRTVHPNRSPDEATHHGFGDDIRGSRIDWIIASRSFIPTAANIVRDKIDGQYPSDHYAVTAVLTSSLFARAEAHNPPHS